MRRERGAPGERRGLWPVLAAPGVLWLLVLFVTPVYAILAVAMGVTDPIFGDALPVWNPVEWDPDTFTTVIGAIFGGRLTEVFLRTIVFVVVASTLTLLIGYPVAYYVARRAGRWKGLLLLLIVAPFWINYIMRMLAWVNLLDTGGLVNQALMGIGLMGAPRNWLAGHAETVVFGLVYGYIPFFILPVYAALDRIDKSVIEAARDLGASPFWAFVKVTLPLSKQGILAGLVIITLPMFGDYYTPNLLSARSSTRMIGNEIELFITSGIGGAEGAAITIVLMLFVAILMLYYLLTVMRAQREAAG